MRISTEIEAVKENQPEMIELSNFSKLKNLLDRFNSKLEETEQISELENETIELIPINKKEKI